MESSKLSGNLPHLQNLIKRDPESYRDEFSAQIVYYLNTKDLLEHSPSEKYNDFCDIILFLAHVAKCYPKDEEISQFPNDLVELLRRHAPVMHPEVRMTIVKTLTLLRNKNLLDPFLLIDISFELLRCQDKMLRKFLQLHIVTDIKNINTKGKNVPLNKQLQQLMSEKLADSHAVAIKTALDVLIELYKKNVWNDKRTANIIATACYSKNAKIMVTALKFFLGNDEGEKEESSDSESEKAPNVQKALIANKVNKKTSKRRNQLEKIKKVANENKKKKNKNVTFDFSALHLINDPQTVAENIFKIFNKRNHRFEVKLLMINMVSRLVGIHELYLSNFFPTIQNFLFPHQRDVTKIMAYAAQATHQSIPPDELYPVLRKLADNFVTERYSNEVMAMGLNAIRELCNRNHHAMDADLLQDLVDYRNHRDKGVYMAARSLMTLYRVKNPHLLAKKTRGVPTELLKETTNKQFGEIEAKDYIPGAEILAFQTKAEDFVGDDDDESSSEDEEEQDTSYIELGDSVECVAVTDDDGEDADDEQEEEDADDELEEEEDDNGEEVDDVEEMEDETEDIDDQDWEDEESVSELPEQRSSATDNKTLPSKVSAKHQPKKRAMNGEVLSKKDAIKEVMKLTPAERASTAAEIVSSRFLTDEDFARIARVQAAKQVERFKTKKGKKRPLDDVVGNDSEIVPLSSIEMIYKKRKHDKSSRMQAILEGRENREKFGSRKGRQNPFASTTNREKSKSKSFDMIKHKKRYTKMKTSFRDKQNKLKKSLLRQLKNN